MACVLVIAWLSPTAAQKLLDRVLARVNGNPITLTDVQAATGLGVIQVPAGSDAIAVHDFARLAYTLERWPAR